MESHDVVILGGGPVGLAAACSVAERGRDVCVVERHDFEHDLTSSTGETRQFRVQHETPALTRLALDAIPMWDALAGDGPPLLHRTPCLWFGDPAARGSTGRIEGVTRVMDQLGLPYETLDAGALAARFPFSDLPLEWTGMVQPHGGVIDVRATLRALHQRCRASTRVTMRSQSEVVDLIREADGIRVVTATGDLLARRVILAPGPHLGPAARLLGLRVDVTLWRMPSAWFAVRDDAVSWPMWVGFQHPSDDDPGQYYGFPEASFAHPGHIRVAGNFPGTVIPHHVDGDLGPNGRATDLIASWVERHMPGLDPEPRFASSCTAGLITSAEDPFHVTHEMLLDLLPATLGGQGDIVICATGWMFKFIPLLGRICADLACDGKTAYDTQDLRIDTTSVVVTRETAP